MGFLFSLTRSFYFYGKFCVSGWGKTRFCFCSNFLDVLKKLVSHMCWLFSLGDLIISPFDPGAILFVCIFLGVNLFFFNIQGILFLLGSFSCFRSPLFSLFVTKFGTFSSFSFLTRISIGEGLIRLTKLVCSVPVKISSLVIKTFFSSFLWKRCLLVRVSYNQDKYRGGTYQTD